MKDSCSCNDAVNMSRSTDTFSLRLLQQPHITLIPILLAVQLIPPPFSPSPPPPFFQKGFFFTVK